MFRESPRVSSNASTIRFTKVYPEVPPLPPRPIHYSPLRKTPQIPLQLLPNASISPPSTPSKKASWIVLNNPPSKISKPTLMKSSWSILTFGTISLLLCFFGIAQGGKRYYLDAAILSGFTSFFTGLLGLRSQGWKKHPNRNFVTGYIVLSILSVCTTLGLVVILILKNFGTKVAPIIDIIGGVECGITILTLSLAVMGICSTCCCKRSPPDNRISHCAEGLTL